jgi:RNA polymerase sigma-70 factor (ECF subfamily)
MMEVGEPKEKDVTAAATPAHAHLAAAMARERPRLVRVCAALTGDPAAAEDLAQEALLQAWRNAGKLRDPGDAAGLARWLDAFARNICLRWRRAQGRAQSRLAAPRSLDPPAAEMDDRTADPDALPDADALDPADACERVELERLLERALATLPVLTREIVVRHYLGEVPHAQIAAELRVSEAVVAQRLHRGRLALRQSLAGALREDAAGFELPFPADDAPAQTRVWCPLCGARRLVIYRWPENGLYGFMCPDCSHGPAVGLVGPCIALTDSNTGLKSPKSILARQLLRLSEYYHPALRRRAVHCTECGRPAAIYPRLTSELPEQLRASLPSQHGITIICPRCGIVDNTPLSHLALDLPASVRFWRAHPRIRHLPEREVEHDGQSVIVTTYESVGDGARLEVLTERDSLHVREVHGAPG